MVKVVRRDSRLALQVSSVLLCGLLAAPVTATTVVAPTFEELVRQAEIVFEGEVIDTNARVSVEREGETITTDVYFRVSKVLKGSVGAVTVLEFLGGTVGDRTFRIDGIPTFARGDRDVIFAAPSLRLISPLVGLMHGRVRVVSDRATNQEVVRQFDGTPLRAIAALGSAERQPVFSSAPALALPAFEAAVLSEVARQNGRSR
jgi:hypothetical protein